MLKHLKNKCFNGDLCLQDADVLASYSDISQHILEFGAGGSTQIMAQGPASILSIETDLNWIEKTKRNLNKINPNHKVEFRNYTTEFNREYDLIFIDGVDHLRRDFGINTWKYLKIGGVMIFHDTRRFPDFQNASHVANLYFNEISKMDVNATASDGISSNMTVIHKKIKETWINWYYSKGKPLWAYGKDTGDISDLEKIWCYK
jgi:predicted O-methyltransferase YrrM